MSAIREAVVRNVVAASLAVLVAAGCSTGVPGAAAPVGATGGTSAAGTGTSFDPCTQLSDADITAFGLDPATRRNADVGNGALARGCGWENEDVTASILVGNQTVAGLAARPDLIEVKTLTVDGVDAVQFRTDKTGNCSVAVPSQGAAVQVNLVNQFASLQTVDACPVAVDIATKLVPLLPR